MKKLDGSACARKERGLLKEMISLWTLEGNQPPHLAIVQAGKVKDSVLFIKNKQMACKKIGIESSLYQLSNQTSQAKVMECIDYLIKSKVRSFLSGGRVLCVHMLIHLVFSSH